MRLEASDIQLVVNIPDHICIYCDPLLVRYAISNLIINSVEHSPPGSSIEVEAVHHGELVEIRVRDHGSGIPDSALDRIFEPFFTLPKINGEFVGTGLGLPYVREVADLHYGGIAITNHAGGGVLAVLSLSV
jgi:two-component system sensor histidine kinase CreC